MPTNILNFNQVATVLNSIHNQATGQIAPVATNTADFVTQANTALLTGFDTLSNAISQVFGRTIFSIRPYSAKFRGPEMSESSYGNAIRKIAIADILLRSEGISDEEIMQACRYVNADSFINKLEAGLDEPVRERGERGPVQDLQARLPPDEFLRVLRV